MENEVAQNMMSAWDILKLIPIAIASSVFGLFLAIGVGYISFSKKVPKHIFWITIGTQMGVSLGIFIGSILWFYSQLVPENIPKDFVTGAAIAYTAGAFPGTTLGLLVLFFNLIKSQVRKLVKDQELKDEILPSMRMRSLIDAYYDDINKQAKKAAEAEQKQPPNKSRKATTPDKPDKPDKTEDDK